MQGYAVAALGGPRWQALVTTMRFVGVDLTGADFRLQVRLSPNTPGAPLVDLAKVGTAAGEGVRLVSVELADGVPVSTVGIRVNETTMEGLPFSGEAGDSSVLAWDMQVTPAGGLKAKWIGGDFIVEAAVTGADAAAPANGAYGWRQAPRLVSAGGGSFQIGPTVISVTMAGGQGPRGLSSGPLGAESVGAEEIDGGDVPALQQKLGITGQVVSLTADQTIPEFVPRAGDAYLLNGHTLTIERMADTAQVEIFVGVGTVVIRSGLARPEWWTVQPLRSAARAVSLGGGGRVALTGRYASEFSQAAPMIFPNVEFEGEKVPTVTAGFAGLQGGTIVEGPFIITAHNVGVRRIGCDAGATVCGSGPVREGLLVINPGQVEGRDPWIGIRVEDVIAVCKEATAPVHALLVENVSGASVRRIQTIYGATGVAGKMRDSVVEDVLARGHSSVAVLDKSDVYAPSLNNKWRSIRCRPITTGDTAGMRIQAATAHSAGHSVSDVSADGCTFVVSLEPTANADPTKRKTLADISIANATGDALRFSGIQMGGPCFRVSINGYRFNNIRDVADGTYGNAVDIRAGVDTVSISTGQSANTTGDGVRNDGGENVLVVNTIAATPGRFGFNAVAGSMKVPAASNIGTVNGSMTA